jgi:hypothetical protein
VGDVVSDDPVKKAVAYYRAVHAQDWQAAYELTQLTWRVYFDPDAEAPKKFPQDLADIWAGWLKEWEEIVEIGTETVVLERVIGSPFIADAYVSCRTKDNRTVVWICRMIKEDQPFHVSPDGEWGVNPVSSIRRKRLDDG